MEKLRRLIKSLKPSEVQLIEDFYTAKYHTNAADNKRLQLFKLLVADKIKNNEEAAHLLYNQKCNSALSHLKKRLEEDILNFLLIDFSDCGLSEATREELHCNKMLLQGKMLIAKGIWEEGLSLLKKTSQLCEKYEFPDIKLASDDILRTYIGSMSELNTYSFYNKRIQKSFEVYEKILEAKANYLTTISKFFDSEQSLGTKCRQIMKPEMLENLENSCICSESKKVNYWYRMTTIKLYMEQKAYEKAKEHACMINRLIESDSSKFSNSEKAQLNIELSKICIHLKDYQCAVGYAETAVKFYDSSTLDYLYALQTLFFAYFRRGEYLQALEVVEMALGHKQIDTIRIQYARWSVFKAAVLFMQGEYKHSNKILLSQDQWPKERSLWLLGSRLLELINILELQDYDWFEFKLESFRKFVGQFNTEYVKRYKLIYSILRTLLKYCGNFNVAACQEKDNLILLGQEKGELGWDPLGYEVVSVDGWFSQKLH